MQEQRDADRRRLARWRVRVVRADKATRRKLYNHAKSAVEFERSELRRAGGVYREKELKARAPFIAWMKDIGQNPHDRDALLRSCEPFDSLFPHNTRILREVMRRRRTREAFESQTRFLHRRLLLAEAKLAYADVNVSPNERRKRHMAMTGS